MASKPPSKQTNSSSAAPQTIVEERFHRSKYEPRPRFGHSTVVVNEKLYLWGGWEKGNPKVHTSQEKTSQGLKMDVMNLTKGEWSQLETYGDPPLGVRGYAMTAIEHRLYYFGGYCGHDFCRHDTIKCLDTMTMMWEDVPCTNPHKSPMKKNACGMVGFKDNGQDYLFVCGGAGMLCSANSTEATYIPWKENPNFGWTNEANIFELSTKSWSAPAIKGDRPPPSAGFSLTQVSPNTAIYIGGFNPFIQECTQDVYKVELSRDTIVWTRLNIATPSDARPRSRHDHSAVCISDHTTEPCVLIAGGRDVRWRSMGDVWILNCEKGCWTKVEVPEAVAHRHYHSLSMFRVNSDCGYAVMFGGVKEWEEETSPDDQPMLSDTTVIELARSKEGVWSVSAYLDSSMLLSTEEYKWRIIQRLFETLQKNSTGKGQLDTPLQTRPNAVYEQTISDLQQQLLSKDVQMSKLETQVEDLSKQLDTLNNDLSALQQKQSQIVTDHPQQATPPESRPVPAPRSPSQLSSAVSRAITAEQVALECTEDVLKPFLLSAHDVAIAGPPIHKGAYGQTVVGTFRGIQVAARVVQHPPTSAFSKMVLMRELVKASQAVHPNIVLFFGAVIDAEVIIVNESMVTDLQCELGKKAFAKQDILNIAKDMAKALMFLHSMKPRPIIHRAVFTHNVFLEPMAFKWRAKLSDTILSNYFHYTSEGPVTGGDSMDGAYCPPEVSDPKLHTPKIDIYSYGTVLLEVLTRKTPPTSQAEKHELLQSSKWAQLTEMIGECLSEEQVVRPSADKILATLDKVLSK